MTGVEMEIQNAYVRGWTFTPLDGKIPLQIGWQKAPRHTLTHAIEWARKHNLGLRTGEVSRIGVIDIDPGAAKGWREFPATVTAITGRGGFHLYYRVDRPLANSQSKLAKGVDVRGDGGQVVFVGSVHPETQARYWWMRGRAPEDIALAEFPWDILPPSAPVPAPRPPITPPDNAEQRCMAYLAKLDSAVSGAGGHDATFNAACVCRRFGLDESAMWRAMSWFNANRCDPPWSQRELAHKIRSAINTVDRDGRAGEMLRDDRQVEAWPAPAQQQQSEEWSY